MEDNYQQNNSKTGYGKGYGKRPLWQWIAIYVVVGGIVYIAIYYLFFAKSGGYNYQNNQSNQQRYNGY